MTEDQRDDLSQEEQKAFRSLREIQRSIGNEERIVKTLKKRGLIHSSMPRSLRWLVQAAAAVAVLAGAFFMGAEYGTRTSKDIEPVLIPVSEEQPAPSRLVVNRKLIEDPTDLDDYRDEPDRPGNGDVLFAKIVNR
jgi:hypothetical protein